MPGSTDAPIDVEEGEWAECHVEVSNGHVSITISDTHAMLLSPRMATRLAKKLKQCAAACTVAEGEN